MSHKAQPHPIVQKDGYRLGQAQDRAFALEALLRSCGIELPPSAPLANVALNAFDVLYRREQGGADDSADIRIQFKHLIGLNELAGLILSVREHPEFPVLIPHLRYLAKGVSIQNMPSSPADQATHHVFELFAGILALHCGSDLALDDATAQGSNPDALITIKHRRWGIACKSLHGINPEGFITHLEKGIDQIEKSPADVGVVLFSIKSLLDQDRYWSITNPKAVSAGAPPEFSAFLDPQLPFAMLVSDANEIGHSLRSYLPSGYLESAFKGKKALPGFLVWAHVGTAVVFDGIPVPASARVMAWQSVSRIADEDFSVLSCLHDAAFAGDKI